MSGKNNKQKTTVGEIATLALEFTAGEDVVLDQVLVPVDCRGTAAHVVMLSELPLKPALFSKSELRKVIAELRRIIDLDNQGKFKITVADQDVHMAVERVLTDKLGELGRRVHTGRSRNDQIAVDLRLFAKEQLLLITTELLTLANLLMRFAYKQRFTPMVGRTHMQPAMPSSVGLWGSAYAEELLDNLVLLKGAYALNDRCPLGSAAGYGVPLPLNRQRVSDLLGFQQVCHNVLGASNMRGKLESVILMALSQIMLTLSRFAQDLMLFTMPEFAYFQLPPELCTGSSIMPQKNNPDILELLRARATVALTDAFAVAAIVNGLPGGYNRDLQEAKAPFMRGLQNALAALRVLQPIVKGLKVNPGALDAGFTPAVFATDRALELVTQGVPFRDAYRHVKDHLAELENMNPADAIALKSHLGGTAGLDWEWLAESVKSGKQWAAKEQRRYSARMKQLMTLK